MAKVTYIVAHPKVNMKRKVNGKVVLANIPMGSEVTLDGYENHRFVKSGMLVVKADSESVEVTDEPITEEKKAPKARRSASKRKAASKTEEESVEPVEPATEEKTEEESVDFSEPETAVEEKPAKKPRAPRGK